MLPQRPEIPFYLGVEIFFIISGYVITQSLMRDRFEALSFFLKRVFRLTPPILLFIGLCAGLNVFLRHLPLSELAQQTFLVPWGEFSHQAVAVLLGFLTLLAGPTSYSNGAMWSLSIEDQFYAALALTCLVCAVLFRRHTPRAGYWLTLALAAAIAGGGLALRVELLCGGNLALTLPAPIPYLIKWRFDFLAVGILLVYVNQWFNPAIVRYFKERGPFFTPFLLLLPLVAASLSEGPFAPHHPILTGLVLPFAAVCFGLLVLLAANDLALPRTRGWLYRLMTYLGDRSYTLYLFHFPIMALVWCLMFVCAPWLFAGVLRYGVAQLLLTLAILLPLVEVVYRCVERPLTARGRRLAGKVRIVPGDPPARPAPAEPAGAARPKAA
jgi:peptidoglycan/LPS O-acetylase OafA/YrhL